jgi:uncharacterized protein YbaP (TraB family)
MKKFTLFFSALALLFSAAAQVPTEKTLLWEVSGNGLKEKSYLYGTFHLLCPEDLIFDKKVTEKLDATKALFLELDFTNPQIGVEMQMGMMMADGHTIREYTDSLTFAQMGDSLKAKVGMPIEMVNSIKPMMLASMLYPSALGCNPGSPEMELVKLADAKGTKIAGLETVSDQMKIFDKIPYDLQTKMLKDYLLTKDQMKNETEQMLGIYRKGDIKAMHDFIQDDKSGLGSFMDLMLYERNRKWVESIKVQSAKEASFYAVGAGHLGGAEGVIALLRKAGFTVKPIK